MANEQSQSDVTQKKAPFIFYVVLILIPILFFSLIEFGLRLADYGREYQFFTKAKGYNPKMIYVNPDMGYKYFGDLTSTVFDSGIGFLEDKPEDCFRVFVLGGSSTQGFPYNFNRNTSFPALLGQRLDKLYPNRTIEVINLGASAINSYTLLDILPSVLAQSPDLILIYTGHNEYYGALGPGSSKSINSFLAGTMLYLRDYRTVQLIENIIINLRKQGQKDNGSLMQKMIGESSIALGSDTYQKGLVQFENNLSSILQKINEANVPAMIGSLSSNIGNQPPFNSSQKEDGMTANDYFELGKKLMLSNDSIAAKSHFIQAKELDGLRFRAPEEINKIIRNKSKEFGVPLVDIDSIFSENSPMNITGESLMCDHLHPNMAGYFLMSKAYYQGMRRNDYLPHENPANQIQTDYELDSLVLDKWFRELPICPIGFGESIPG
jgi:lysophospholipase L1-like esterase